MEETIKQVKKIEIKTKKLVDCLISGNYHSVFKGNGIEFSEIRDYRAGDDIRSIDWKVTARFNHPYIKEFIEERDLNVYFVLDISGSGIYGTSVSKKRKSIELIASLMFSAAKNNDNVGMFLITDSVEKFIPLRKGKKHVIQMLKELIFYEPQSRKTNLDLALKYILNIVRKRSVMFIVSDFMCEDDFFKPLKIMKKRHDLTIIKIADEREKEIPDVGLIELEDSETDEQILVDTSDTEFRKKYLENNKNIQDKLINSFRRQRIDFIEILSDEDYEKPLRRFFKFKKHEIVK
jgi:uncharacterized protein (DUF58 family)|tara:strand:+ start:5009 stop:5884 length:876 start_codon:yes stop_codon:yes gene_type:complete